MSTTRPIKAVASDPQLAQGNLLRHQRTYLPPSKSKWKNSYKSRSQSYKRYSREDNQQQPPHKKRFDPNPVHNRKDRCHKCGDSKHVEGLQCPARKYQCRNCHKHGHFSSLCFKKRKSFDKRRSLESRSPKAHQLQVSQILTQDNSICSESDELTSSDESLCLQVKVQNTQADTKFPTPHHLLTNLEYRLKPHHRKNKFLRARLDTCTDINIMPVSIYKLVFQDPDCEKLAPSNKLEIGTYTTNRIKVIGSCILFVVHPDTQCLQEVTFYVTSHGGSVVLSCATSLVLSLIQPHTSLDHLSKGVNLISSSADHSMKNESQLNIHVLSKKSEVFT